jgi:hypothetical protein
VKIIEQPPMVGAHAPFALVHCPDQDLVILTRYVITTPSIGLIHSSIQHKDHLRSTLGNRLQPKPKLEQEKLVDFEPTTTASLLPVTYTTKPANQATIHHAASGSSERLVTEREAAILFDPPLSSTKREQFLARGMGLENKCILVFPRGSRFWPSDIHLLRSATHPSWRFYNLDGISSSDVSVLVAHRPPAGDEDRWRMSAQQLETMSDEDILRELMLVLHQLFTPDHIELTRRDIDQLRSLYPDEPAIKSLPRSKHHLMETKTAQVRNDPEAELTTCPGSDTVAQLDDSEDIHAAQHNAFRRALAHPKWDVDWRSDEQQTPGRVDDDMMDTSWQGKRVVPPLHMEVTRWSRDPYSLGAYSFSE